MSMLTKIQGCSETDYACLCANPDFVNGVHDCTVESCPADSANDVLDVGSSFCESETNSNSTVSADGSNSTSGGHSTLAE